MDRPQRSVLSFAGLFVIRLVDSSSGLPDFFSLPDFFRALEGVHPSSSLTVLPGSRGASRCLEASQRLSGLENGFSNFVSFFYHPIISSAYLCPNTLVRVTRAHVRTSSHVDRVRSRPFMSMLSTDSQRPMSSYI